MRGGMVVRLGPTSSQSDTLLDSAVRAMRWHGGSSQTFSKGDLVVMLAADPEAGPFLDEGREQTLIVHGHRPVPVANLQASAHRFVALEWNGARLAVTRDAFGLVPLFYRGFDGAAWLSTEVGPLLALGAADPDLAALVSQAADVRMVSHTGWTGIHRVLPGTTVCIDSGLSSTITRWWRPQDYFGKFHRSRAQASEQFAIAFSNSVKASIAPDMGILASGGLDSSAVASVAAHQGARPHLFHINYPSIPHTDEAALAKAVADHSNLPLTNLEGDLSTWEPWGEIAQFSLPLETVPIGMYEVGLRALSERSGAVMLDGHDGDGILGETPQSLRGQLALHGRFKTLARLAAREGPEVTLRGLAANIFPPQFRFRRMRHRPTQAQLTGFGYYFCNETLARINALRPWQFPPAAWRAGEFSAVMPPFTLVFEEFEMIAASMGIEIRHPFTHPQVVREMLALPFVIKIDPLQTKVILRDGLAQYLPAQVAKSLGKSSFDGVLERRVDLDACMKVIEESGVEIPGVDYRRLRNDAHHNPDFIRMHPAVTIALTRIHAFVAAA